MVNDKVIKRRIASAENMAVRSRNYRRARERALTRLAQLHKEEYLELLEEEKKKDEQEGKAWRTINGADASTSPDNPANYASQVRRDTATGSQDEGDNV